MPPPRVFLGVVLGAVGRGGAVGALRGALGAGWGRVGADLVLALFTGLPGIFKLLAFFAAAFARRGNPLSVLNKIGSVDIGGTVALEAFVWRLLAVILTVS